MVIALLLLTSTAPMLNRSSARFVLREAIETDEAGVNIAEALTGGDAQYVPSPSALTGLAAVRTAPAHA